ncbi:DUF58 domain-containing protein [Sporolactobacillus sp. STSJ-5]|uniref:DUF58 domain-containing protein n=1 Tax=Sporolactobacillus sp. STSJ-5 TaxID=2965076 RepID=UPI0021043EBA|nr:DUF58 domain-containing protein [Sporolactobacillus sp. STSJ-5]MCQ2009025.1 DUF58 domain-containing protein [Sporolactobacillus sp. STSJ-5]
MKGYAADWQTRNQSLFYLFGFIVFLIGFLRNTFLLSITGLIFIVFAFLSKWYLVHMIRTLSIENTDRSLRLSAGDEGELIVTFLNSSKLPLFSLRGRIVSDPIVSFSTGNHSNPNPIYQFSVTIPAQKKLLVHCPVKAMERGTARIRTFELTCSDPLHLVSCGIHFNEMLKSHLIIYPQPKAVSHLNLAPPQHLGEVPSAHSLFQDYTAPSGIRNYASSDPFKHIHWKASARTGRLQTKTFERVAHQSWTFLFLNASNHLSHERSSDFEKRISAAAWLARDARKRDIEFSMYSNTKTIGQKILGIEPEQGGNHLRKVWELLAFMQKWQIKTPIPQAMQIIDKKLSHPSVLILMDLDQPELAAPFLSKWLKNGHLIFQLCISENTCILEPVEKGAIAIG